MFLNHNEITLEINNNRFKEIVEIKKHTVNSPMIEEEVSRGIKKYLETVKN